MERQGTWVYAPALFSLDSDHVFRLSSDAGPVQLPARSLANEFFNPLPPSLLNSTGMEANNCSIDLQVAIVFVATHRIAGFQMFDQLRHGIGMFELFRATFPGRAAARARILVLDTSHRAIDTLKLRAFPRLGEGLLLASLAMGFNRSTFADRVADWPASRPLCVRAEAVAGGHSMYDEWGRHQAPLSSGSPRLHRFRRAIANTLRVGRRAKGPGGVRWSAGVLVVLRRGPRRFVNEEDLLRSGLAERVQRETGLPLSFVRLETLSVEEQFIRIAGTSILVGNHGAGLTWAALLPSDAHNCAVIELHANASSDGLPVDIRHFAGLAGIRHVPLPQKTSDECHGQLIRSCGDVVVDSEELLRTIVTTARVLQHRLKSGSQ